MNLESYEVFADAIQAFFGDLCEVVIHDLRNPQASLSYIKGNLTNRKVGDAVTNIILDVLKKPLDEIPKYFIADMESQNGKRLKSLSILIKDDKRVYGCFCILIDPSIMSLVVQQLSAFLNNANTSQIEKETSRPNSVVEMADQFIDEALKHANLTVPLMQKEDKYKIVSNLNAQGVFMIKGSVETVAKKLGISRYTVYSYLDEIKGQMSG